MPRPHAALALSILALAARPAAAVPEKTPVPVHRASGPIKIDGDLSDPAWSDAVLVDTFYETNPGDNVPPAVQQSARISYDDRFFYVAIDLRDPDPSKIRAPLGDRDNIGGDIDFAGVILDTRGDGKTGLELFVTAQGIQFDAVQDDNTGNEDASPDFFWDAKSKRTAEGWTVEMRVPFSSLRYPKTDPSTWGVIVYRNYPRAFRYQIFSSRLPRGSNCFVCNAAPLTGLTGLPHGGHVTLAPYANASRMAERPDGGTELGKALADGQIGGDLKWTPTASTVIDGTVNPDFSQIESDVAQISTNEKFALFYPEKRPFFLEGVELLSTPIQAVYTRTITDPMWGGRTTGRRGSFGYTALVSQDEGGGSVVLPGPDFSDTADQDFRSWTGIARARRDFGTSFIGGLATIREIEGGGHNRVIGPDFQWRPSPKYMATGQLLFSDSLTPNRPDLADEWNGQSLSGHAADLWFQRTTPKTDQFLEGKSISDGFRADDGFVPQVGYQGIYAEAGRTFRPTKGLVRRLRTFGIYHQQWDQEGSSLLRDPSIGFGLDGRWNSFVRLRYAVQTVRTDDLQQLDRNRLYYTIQASPVRWLSNVGLEGWAGGAIDFDNNRPGSGLSLNAYATLRPTDHIELRLTHVMSMLDVDQPDASGRLFTSRVERVRAQYTFNPRMFARAIVQYVDTRRDPALYADAVDAHEGNLGTSLLLAYKLNWQTVVFLGWGDEQERDVETVDAPLRAQSRSLFAKVSYAFQR